METGQIASARTVLCILHHPRSSLGVIGQWLYEYGVSVVSMLGRTANFTTLDAKRFDAIIVFGSAESVNSMAPWVRDELAWLEKALKARRRILGICFGAQLLALAAGGRVNGNRNAVPHLGYLDLHPTPAGNTLFAKRRWRFWNWNYESIDLDGRGSQLAVDDDGVMQAFWLGSALGLQFHPEITEDLIARWCSLSASSEACPPLERELTLHKQLRAENIEWARKLVYALLFEDGGWGYRDEHANF